jgi:hypothetical protein
MILAGPTKQRAVKALGRILVGSGKFDPAKTPRGMLVDYASHGAQLPPSRVNVQESQLSVVSSQSSVVTSKTSWQFKIQN